ncbi:MAG: hypothetical protein ACXWLI_06490, partial [Myxococcaceae bacterium]
VRALMLPDPVGVSSLGEAAGQASGNQATTGIALPPADQTAAPATSAAPAPSPPATVGASDSAAGPPPAASPSPKPSGEGNA